MIITYLREKNKKKIGGILAIFGDHKARMWKKTNQNPQQFPTQEAAYC